MFYLKRLILIFTLIVLFQSVSRADNPVDQLHYKEAQNKILEALYVETGLEKDVEKTVQYITENYSNKFIDFAMPIVNIAFKKRVEVRYEF